MTTEERLEKVVKERPERWLVLARDKTGVLLSVEDGDTGRTWLRRPDGGWNWIE